MPILFADLRETPYTALDEMVERLRDERAVTMVRTAVWKFLTGWAS
jgi:hypothetical protein